MALFSMNWEIKYIFVIKKKHLDAQNLGAHIQKWVYPPIKNEQFYWWVENQVVSIIFYDSHILSFSNNWFCKI